MTGAAKDLKVYQGNDIKSETKDVTVEETDEAGNPTKIKFYNFRECKDNRWYLSSYDDQPNGNGNRCFLKVVMQVLREMKTYQMEQKKIRFILRSSVDTILKQLLHTKMEK